MKIRMKTLAAGPEGIWPAGHEVDLPDEEAKRLIAGGYAEEVIPSDVERQAEAGPGESEEEPVRETAAVEPPEQAVVPKKTVKRRKSGESSGKTA